MFGKQREAKKTLKGWMHMNITGHVRVGLAHREFDTNFRIVGYREVQLTKVNHLQMAGVSYSV